MDTSTRSSNGYPLRGHALCPAFLEKSVFNHLQEHSALPLSIDDLRAGVWKRYTHDQCLILSEIVLEAIAAVLMPEDSELQRRPLPANVAIEHILHRQISDRLRSLLEHLAEQNISLADLTVGQVLYMKNVGLSPLLELLLIMEDIQFQAARDIGVVSAVPMPTDVAWPAAPEPENLTEPPGTGESAEVEKLTDEERRDLLVLHAEQVRQILDGDQIDTGDIRFGRSIGALDIQRLSDDEIAGLLKRLDAVPPEYPMTMQQLVEELTTISSHSVMDEIRDIVYHAAHLKRDCDMYLEFRGWTGGETRPKLDELAAKFHVPRERARSTCMHIDRVISEASVYSPLLRELSAVLSGRVPFDEEQAKQDCMNRGFDVRAFTTRTLKDVLDVLHQPSFDPNAKPKPLPVTRDEEQNEALMRYIHRWSTAIVNEMGLASFPALMRELADIGKQVERDEVIQLLTAQPDVEWNDEEHHHFTIQSARKEKFLHRVEKILSAVGCIDLKKLLDIAFEPDPQHRRSVPAPAYGKFFARIPGVYVLPSNTVLVDPTVFESALSDSEQVLVDILKRYRGFATSHEIYDACREAGLRTESLAPVLATTPAIVRLARGFYALPDHEVDVRKIRD